MKKFSKGLLVTLSLLLVFSLLTACSSQAPATSAQTSAAPAASVSESVQASLAQSSAAASQAPAASGTKHKAALVTAQRLGDQGVTDLCNSGFQKAAKEFGYDTQIVEVQKGEYEETIRSLCEEGFDTLVILYVELVDATAKVAPDFPNVHFVSILGQIDQPNVQCSLGNEHEGSYLAGIEAGMLSKASHIGFVGGQDNAEINRFLAGYEQGAKSINPNIKVDPVYVGSFEDPTKGKDLSLMLYNQGCDVVYAAAAKSGLGMFDAAKETKKYCIGVDVNQNGVAPGYVIGSMTIAYDKWIYDAMKQIANNEFKAGVFWRGIDGNYVGLTLPTDDQFKIPDDVKKAVENAAAKIKSGEIKVDPVASKDKK